MYLYEYLENVSVNELKELCGEFLLSDNEGTLPKNGKVRLLMDNFKNYSLVKVRNEVNYEVVRRFVGNSLY